MKRLVINLGGYGDFDSPYVDSVWLAPDGYDKSQVKSLADEIANENSNTNDVDKAAKRLKREGFTPLKSYDCLVGGNL